ncbi:MAG: L-threonylcarbamoyladenylate synthase [Planctomycetia bacterium]|nr:L-threonylcarbamoyladenylate synthase [Planctomycetia bacterium]
MPANLLNIKETDENKAIQNTVNAFREGKLVIVPTETVYGIGALASNSEAVDRLVQLKKRQKGHVLPVAISGSNVLRRYVPDIDPISERLARRCWPGPLTLSLDGSAPESGFRKFSKEVQGWIMPCGRVGIRVPNHPFLIRVLQELDEPIVLTSANYKGNTPVKTGVDAQSELGEGVDLILDDGPAMYGTPSTVLQVTDKKIIIIREGAISRENIKRLTAKIILFVCTGNTCRSPMAEILCCKLLAKNLDCNIADLEENGFLIMSAGLATTPNHRAAPEAKDVMRSYNLSLERHESQPLSSDLLRFADLIFVMGKAHQQAIISASPEAQNRVHLLSTRGKDIDDPLGGNFTIYQNCAQEIENEIANRMDLILQ